MADARLGRPTLPLQTLGAASALLVWGAFVVLIWMGKLFVPSSVVRGSLVGVPTLAVGAALMVRRACPRWLTIFAAGSSLVAAAIWSSTLIPAAPRLILMVAAVPVAAVVVRRWPGQFMVLVVFLSGAPGLLYAYTPIAPGRITDFALVGLWTGAIVGLLSDRRPRRTAVFPPVVMALAAFGLVTLARAVTSPHGVKAGLVSFRQNAWILLIVIPIAYGGWSERTIRWAAEGSVYVAAFVGVWGTFRWITGPSGRETVLYFGGGVYNYVSEGSEGLKAVSPQLSGHALGGWTGAALVFCVAAALGGPKRVRIVALGGAGALAVALFGSSNRTGLVAALIGIVVVAALMQLSRSDTRQPTRALAVLAALAIFGLAFFPLVAANNPTKAARYADILTPSKDESFQARLEKWKGALRDADTHPFGHGLGTAVLPAPGDYQQSDVVAHAVDSTYVQVAYEEGVPAMVLFIVTMLLLVYTLGRSGVQTTNDDHAWVAIGACGAMTAFAVLIFIGQYLAPDTAEGFFVIAGLGLAPFLTRRYAPPDPGAPVAAAPSPATVGAAPSV